MVSVAHRAPHVPVPLPPEVTAAMRHRQHGSHGSSVTTVKIDRVVLSLVRGAPRLFGYPPMETRILGEVLVEVCATCLYATTHCTHTRCTWRYPDGARPDDGDPLGDTGQRLICDLCGIDGS